MKKLVFLLTSLFLTSALLASENQSPEIMKVSNQYLNSPGGRAQYKDILKLASDAMDAKDAENKQKEAAPTEDAIDAKDDKKE